MKLFPLHILPNDTKIDFMRWRHVAMVVTIIVFLASIAIIGFKGFNYALDFTGGTLIEARFERPVDVEQVRTKLEQSGFDGAQVQSVGGSTDLLIRLAPHGEHAPGTGDSAAEDKATAAAVVKALSSADNQATVLRNEFVGPQIGKDLAMNGLYATIFMLAGFLIYIAVRFEWKFAVTASIVAMFDLIVTVAYVSLLGREFDLTVLAGLLSVMGFAINDIIVVFDRVRENFRSLRVEPMEVLNRSINQTLSRTVITAVMFFLSALALYLYGGSSMEGLAETHMIGAVIVVMSSILVAVPMLTIGFLRVSKQDLLPKAKDIEALARRP
ncbi:protein translocase subunit SecF [Stenotrophomonas maltophilia]|jgi:preprotein translocase subunit SecF|uniref:Protein-export membrane protein SecF n=1 Tax=Stenotrophomonas maltophilia TaxID=40324 RepID=A0AAP7GVA2_STEMA|nr:MULTISPECIES: protein translocase subunit SecF [Stenotrophomonas]KOQ67965.1 preprotein translocase subunit SecF [Stenotrophomonas maltophilia]MBA0222609.1 protein translocase subunit SecF [Stenotrophomonas maltophilia]MBE5270518.1 protein translocase subunit SecF [Stenotrophomonas sp. B2]MBH1593751.1 protein translocase subunit SecF [Stenotrophomonas maltophilia]MBH1665672.1 protein translocase subunit SecF [Stenotrophomonas maltophilia]